MKLKDLAKMIHKKNKEFKQENYVRLSKNPVTFKMLKKASKYKCYLGFDVEFNWLNELEEMAQEIMCQ